MSVLSPQIQIFHFVFSQWDRHFGNIAFDATGHAGLYDNADIYMRTQAEYGQIPFVRRAEVKDADILFRSKSFPFANPQIFHFANEGEYQKALGQYLEPSQAKRNWKLLEKQNLRDYAIIYWDHSVWTQRLWKTQMGPAFTSDYYPEILAEYRALTYERLRFMLPNDLFSGTWIKEALERRDRVLAYFAFYP